MEENKFEYNNLYAGPKVVTRDTFVLSKGQNVKAGTALGRLDNGEVVPVDRMRSDSAKTIYCIASEDCDATSEAKRMVVDLEGEFNVRSLIFAAGNTAANHEIQARTMGMYFKSSIAK